MRCPRCAEFNDNNSQYCKKCGTSLTQEYNPMEQICNTPCNDMKITLRGRISFDLYRNYYYIIISINLLLCILEKFYINTYYEEVPPIATILFLVGAIVLVVLTACADTRRFHDFNFSGWLLIPCYIGIAIIDDAVGHIGFSAILPIIWSSIIGPIPSTVGKNKYGTKSNVI